MAKTNRIEIRVTEAQRKQMQSNAQAYGYVTLSSYLRDRGIDFFFATKKLIIPQQQKTLTQFIKIQWSHKLCIFFLNYVLYSIIGHVIVQIYH